MIDVRWQSDRLGPTVHRIRRAAAAAAACEKNRPRRVPIGHVLCREPSQAPFASHELN